MRITLFLLLPFTMADTNMKLLLVHGIWRHGDRSPMKTFPNDPIQEDDWKLGGGGFGQLTPTGMAQHFKFGKLLRKVYVDTGFLSKKYSSKEIYVRSTDVNRTIISAMSNLLGMYGQNDKSSQPGVDYPNEEGWPVGYVPIAIHTVEYDTDYIGNPDAHCKRQKILWDMAKTSAELQAFQKREDVVNLLNNLTTLCGQTVDIDNLWEIRDTLLIEQNHMDKTLREKNKWFTDELFKQITDVNDQIDLYYNGIFNGTLMMENLDIGLEIQKIRGGSLFNDINMRIDMKLDCLNKNLTNCSWINNLKYYVYSSHDTTLYAFLSIMGIEKKVIQPTGYPAFSAGAFIELWTNGTDKEAYFKVLYHNNEKDDSLHPITEFIDGCSGPEYCKLDVFKKFADRTKPREQLETWCNVDPRNSSASSFLVLYIALSSLWLILRFEGLPRQT